MFPNRWDWIYVFYAHRQFPSICDWNIYSIKAYMNKASAQTLKRSATINL